MAAAAGAARLSSSSHLMDEGVGSRSSRSGRRLPSEFCGGFCCNNTVLTICVFWNLLMRFWLSALTWPVILSQITILEFLNEILQSDLAMLMILKFMLLCGYENMAVNNIYAFQRLQMPQGLPNKGSLKRNGLTKKGCLPLRLSL
ncbi:uncharacterized protein [Aegilops tauschii subsp. strangulata]|uniref:uncharacterized protein n=1 Tax=Aegilops tauschii subsp. strangulata TaxID=200361 RepID=UPI00098B1E3A